jgi:hypothetical protein
MYERSEFGQVLKNGVKLEKQEAVEKIKRPWSIPG